MAHCTAAPITRAVPKYLSAHLLANKRCTGGFIDSCRCEDASAAAFSLCSGIAQTCPMTRRFNRLHMCCIGLDGSKRPQGLQMHT